jgi:glycerol-3-phosphate dehydrogenase (NAD(P)+)
LNTIKTVGVIGAGAWGTALAQVCARAGLSVTLWAFEADVAADILKTRTNSAFLPGVKLDDSIDVTTELADMMPWDMILAVAPAQHMRRTLAGFADYIQDNTPVVLCSKGVEQGSLKLMTEVLAETLPTARPAVLSGPSFAGEVAKGLPTAVTLACANEELGRAIAEAIATPTFRPYLANDMIGAEAGGTIKNILAIACGMVEGRGLGRSAHASVITRGFAEMTRFAVALGAEPETLAGLCGLGDLVLTCSSPQSRNMSVGLALGQGMSLEEALSGKLSVAEGVASAPAVRQLALKLNVELPICEAVAAILAGEVSVEAAMTALLSRPLKSEF